MVTSKSVVDETPAVCDESTETGSASKFWERKCVGECTWASRNITVVDALYTSAPSPPSVLLPPTTRREPMQRT